MTQKNKAALYDSAHKWTKPHTWCMDIGKGKVHPCTGTEALYRPYGPQGE